MGKKTREEQAAENRKRYPITAEIVDEFRKYFQNVRVIKTNEERK